MGFLDVFKKKGSDITNIGQMGQNFDMQNSMPMGEMNDPLGLDHTQQATEQNNPYAPSMNLSTMGMNSSQNYQQQPQQTTSNDKDMQIISLKLDAIKSELDAINQRIKNIENIAEKEQQPQTQQKRWY